ncbi:aspartate aminotransferase family protein [Pseudomonadota bacterium]
MDKNRSEEIIDLLQRYEPKSVSGQPPVVWEKAEGMYVFDVEGRCYLDWSSGVLVANVGHGHPEIIKAIEDIIKRPLLFSYSFPTEVKAMLLQEMQEILIRPNDKTFLLSTGAEAVECAIKLAKTYALQTYGEKRKYIVSFENGFHGRTLGAQMAGGIPSLKAWTTGVDGPFVQVPFPDGFRSTDLSFDAFRDAISDKGIEPEQIAGVLMESYQGGGASFAPVAFMQQLATWTDEHNIALIMDEVQSGFGRTGKWFAFEHYGIKPDLVCCGKGISSSLPLSAVIGRDDLLDLYPPGSMTSTHGGHPVCCAAALANLRAIKNEGIVENAERVGSFLGEKLKEIGQSFPQIGAVHGMGMVYALHMVKDNGDMPDADLARRVVKRCCENGLLLFSPVGYEGANIKICPPLIATSNEIEKGIAIFQNSLREEININE